jgi:putative ABC transport system permease protein
MSVISLSPVDLAIAASLVLFVALLQWRMRLGNTQSLLIAGMRTVAQLLLLGLVLKYVFAASNLLWIAVMATVMLLAAGREVMVRQKRRFQYPERHHIRTG